MSIITFTIDVRFVYGIPFSTHDPEMLIHRSSLQVRTRCKHCGALLHSSYLTYPAPNSRRPFATLDGTDITPTTKFKRSFLLLLTSSPSISIPSRGHLLGLLWCVPSAIISPAPLTIRSHTRTRGVYSITTGEHLHSGMQLYSRHR